MGDNIYMFEIPPFPYERSNGKDNLSIATMSNCSLSVLKKAIH